MSNIGVASKSRREKPSWPNGYLRQWIIPVLIVAITVIAFYPALKNAFVNWDDDKSILENPFYRGLHWTNLRWMFTTFHMGHYQPLSWLSFSFDYLLWGVEPFGYHLTTILIHTANAVLFYYLSRRLLRLSVPSSNGVVLDVAAAFAALIFAIHPLRVESVAWATERRDVLSGFFLLLTVLSYLKAVTPETGKASQQRWIAIAVVFYVLSLFSKASGMTLPLVLLVLDVYPLRRLGQPSTGWSNPKTHKVWREKIPFFVLALSAGVIALSAQYQAGAMKSLEQHSVAARLAQSFYGVTFYLWKTIMPFGLSPLYEISAGYDPSDWRFLVSGLVVLAISLALIRLRRRWPGILACWATYLLILAPTLGVAQSGPQFVANRYSYLSCMSWAILAGAGGFCFWQAAMQGRMRKRSLFLGTCGLAVMVLGLGFLTWRQTQIWHDSETLWNHVLSTTGESLFARNNLGNALAAQGRFDEAINQFQKALKIDPNDADAAYNLGNALAQQGNLEAAGEQLELALQIKPDNAMAAYDLGNVRAKQGRLGEAVDQFQRALNSDPGLARARYNLGQVFSKQGKRDEAIRNYRLALGSDPTHVKAHYYLAIALSEQGDFQGASKEFREALRVEPELAEAHAGLARALSAQGKKDEALQHYQEALRLLKTRSQQANEGSKK